MAGRAGGHRGAGLVVASQPRRARLFVLRGGVWKSLGSGGPLTVAELRHGTKLALEGLGIVRDRAVWDGGLRVVVRVQARGRVATNFVRFRMAPVLFENNTMPLERVFAMSDIGPADNTDAESTGDRILNVDENDRPIDQRTSRHSTRRVEPPTAGMACCTWCRTLHVRLDPLPAINGDRWMQDFYQPAYVAMPGPHGTPRTITRLLRSATRIATRSTRRPATVAQRLPHTVQLAARAGRGRRPA